jgi:ABC-type multidrug transport system ATPase subunit
MGDKINKDYKDFSGGEKQRLDMCLMFAMHQLISAGTDMNILVMDEALENLDEAGEEAAFSIIRTIAEEGKSIYLISHSAVLDSLYSNTIQIEKDSTGNTIIV